LHSFPENAFALYTLVFPLGENAESNRASFYIEDAEEGERPFLCTPSPKTADIHRLVEIAICG